MASQRARFVGVLALAICTGCGATSGVDDTANNSSGQFTSSRSDVPIYSTAGPALRLLAARFVRTVAAYDARTAAPRDFLGQLTGLATPAERQRLSHSPRNHLDWPVLRLRAERTHLSLNGVSVSRAGGRGRLVVVEATATTRTGFATVRTFQEFWLTLVLTPQGWSVDQATGPGL